MCSALSVSLPAWLTPRVQRQELFPAAQLDPSQPAVPKDKVTPLSAVSKGKGKIWTLNSHPLSLLSECSARKPPWQAFVCRNLLAPIPMMLAHAEARTKCACKISIDPLDDHVLPCKKHSGSIRGHSLDVMTNLARN